MDPGPSGGPAHRRPRAGHQPGGAGRSPRCAPPRTSCTRRSAPPTAGVETLRREVEVVKVNESVQKAQAAVTARGAGAGAALGSAADSLARIKERQAIRGEKIKRPPANWKTAARARTLTRSCSLAGILPGQSSADDVLARARPRPPRRLQIEASGRQDRVESCVVSKLTPRPDWAGQGRRRRLGLITTPRARRTGTKARRLLRLHPGPGGAGPGAGAAAELHDLLPGPGRRGRSAAEELMAGWRSRRCSATSWPRCVARQAAVALRPLRLRL